MSHNILVIGELDEGSASATTRELLAGASEIASGGNVSVTLLGAGASQAVGACAGANTAYASDDVQYDDFRGDQWISAIQSAVEAESPDVILVAQSIVGREVGPRLSHKLGTAVAMDCVSISDEGGSIKATRPCFGGNAMATYGFSTSPAIATVRAKSFEVIEGGSGPSTSTELPAASQSRTEIIATEAATSEGLQIQDATVVVCGGRGLGDAEAFGEMESIASAIGLDKAAVGASRAAVDLGWYPPSQQVGLTGKVVTPDLYLAVAVSGASQHMAGCSGSKTIVGINRDEEANIWSFSRYGIIGDYKQVVPALIEELKKASGN